MKQIDKHLIVSLSLRDGEVFVSVEEPESGEASGATLSFDRDEHVELDEWIGEEVHSWLSLWADELEEDDQWD